MAQNDIKRALRDCFFSWDRLWKSTNARNKESDRTRPPSVRGGRGHGWDVHAWEKTSGRGRDGGSTAECRRGERNSTRAISESSPLRMDHAEACISGHPQYSSRRPPGGPPLGGGRLLAHAPFSEYRPAIPAPSFPSANTVQEIVWRIFALQTGRASSPSEPFLSLRTLFKTMRGDRKPSTRVVLPS